MIIFATRYDDATEGCYVVARLIPPRALPEGTERLLGDAAEGETLKQRLQSFPAMPLLAFSHGKITHLCGHGGIPAIEPADGSVVGQRSVFVYACWTADGLGQQIASHGAIWWGFTGEIAALPQDERTARVLARLFGLVSADLPRVTTVSRVQQYLVRVRTLCEVAGEELRSLHLTGHRVDPYGYYALEHILRRLRVWLPGATAPLYDAANGTPVSIPRL